MRGTIFIVLGLVAVLYVTIYIVLSAPGFQEALCRRVEKEISSFLGSKVEIGSIDIIPFSEVVITDIRAYTPKGEKCIYVEKVGAGINLYKLIFQRKIDVSYVELIGLDGNLKQDQEGGPLNIQFIIDAFKPKEENKPPTKFNLALRNVVLRKCAISFDKTWMPESVDKDRIDFNHLKIKNLRADLILPILSNEEVSVDLRRLAFELSPGPQIEKLVLNGKWSPDEIELYQLQIFIGETYISPKGFKLKKEPDESFVDLIKREGVCLNFEKNTICPADFKCFVPQLGNFRQIINFNTLFLTDLNSLDIEHLSLQSGKYINLYLSGDIKRNIDNYDNDLSFNLNRFDLDLNKEFFNNINNIFSPQNNILSSILKNQEDFSLKCKASSTSLHSNINCDLQLSSALGNIAARIESSEGFKDTKLNLNLEDIDLSSIIDNYEIGTVSLEVDFAGYTPIEDLEKTTGELNLDVSKFEFRNLDLGNLSLHLDKSKELLSGYLTTENELIKLNTDFSVSELNGEGYGMNASLNISDFYPDFIVKNKFADKLKLDSDISIDITAYNRDNFSGKLNINNLTLAKPSKKDLKLNNFDLEIGSQGVNKNLDLKSDWIEAEMTGMFNIEDLAVELKNQLNCIFPAFFPSTTNTDIKNHSEIDIAILIPPDNTWTEYFELPVRLLVPVQISAYIDGENNKSGLSLDLPYLQQGKDKLIYDTRLYVVADGEEGELNMEFGTTLPAKKGDVALNLNLTGHDNLLKSDISWKNPDNPNFKGLFSFDARLEKNDFTQDRIIKVDINPSKLSMGTEDWYISPSNITYEDKVLDVKGFKIWHDNQYVTIEGKASESDEDVVTIALNEIDVDYVFGTLNINYVTFGGEASGEITGSSLFSKQPVAQTKKLIIKDLSYNGTVVGDGDITSRWNNDQKEVEIKALISGPDGNLRVNGDGGVFLAADSLCFDIEAKKVPVGFVQPFMKAFSSHVGGEASGKVRLAGNFHDIDMTGKIFADSVNIKLDYTNTFYHGSDSIFLYPGRIEIPGFSIYDDYGNSAKVIGELTHRYFHDPEFTFRLQDANNFLCYDTSSSDNPDWYGKVFGSGGARIQGWPGFVDIGVDMTLLGNSNFTFVLNETQAASDYHFLTFTDKRKEAALIAEKDTVTDFKTLFRKKINESSDDATSFALDIRATVTPSLLFTLVMDPAAGDKINARGTGAIQVEYNSAEDQMKMYGRYTLDEGNYNFSLHDLILRDFKIVPGGYIAFNGDPLDADLNISASYRVNTNLSDLDKSFSTDRDLARTNVPVDAILSVAGHLTSPEITFDIDLPTLTQDVERKVKSIISTDDMMNRQIIYLLALNKFYTPEYMGSSSNGGELAAVASSTLSSQLQNMLGQLTDKFTVSPSFRTDKGDFSDIEVDVALSSKLLNNRLLLNGNFGYRDKSTSSTTFVGDFDLEYLLSKNGNLRLKAYNHFNDQNYYLREALTTQGLGIIYRKDFDNPFKFLQRKKKEDEKEDKNDKKVE